MTPDQLAKIWWEIENSHMPHERGWVRRLLNPDSVVPVYAAVASMGGARSLMIDIPISALGVLQELPITRGLAVKLEAPLKGVPTDQRTLLLALEDRQYDDIFDVFCSHLIEGLSNCTKVFDATTLLLARLNRWQNFLNHAHDQLGKQAIVGLFGELWFMRDLLIPLAGVSALASWTGAQKAPQDFIFPGVGAFEVKTSTTRPMNSVIIHGERQLDDTGLHCLFLASIRLELDDTGESLNEVVAALRARAMTAPEFAVGFESLLAQAGWLDRHAPQYDLMRFRVAQQRFFDVSGDFPRLLSKSLAAGIDNVDYELHLNACASHEKTRADVEQTFSSLDLHPSPPS